MLIWYMNLAMTADAESLVDDRMDEADYVDLLLGGEPYVFTTKAQAIAFIIPQAVRELEGQEDDPADDPTDDDLWIIEDGERSGFFKILNLKQPPDEGSDYPNRVVACAIVGSTELRNG